MLINTIAKAFYVISPFFFIFLYLAMRKKPLTAAMSIIAIVCMVYSIFLTFMVLFKLSGNIENLPDSTQSLVHIIHQLLLLLFVGFSLFKLAQKRAIAYYWTFWVFLLAVINIKVPEFSFYTEKTPALYLSYTTTQHVIELNLLALFGLLYVRYYYLLLLSDDSNQSFAYRKRNVFYPVALMLFLFSLVLHVFVVQDSLDLSIRFGYMY